MPSKEPKEPRPGFIGILDRMLAIVNGVKGLALIFAALSVGGASGTLMASDKKDTAARVDSVEVRLDTLEARYERSEQLQMEIYSAQVEADTALRGVLERRAENHRKAAESRAATRKLVDDIMGAVQ